MDYPNCLFVDCAFNGVQNRGDILRVDKIPPYEDKTDCFKTYFRYPEKFKTYAESNINPKTSKPSVKSYEGDAYSDFLPIDIDAPDLETSYKMTQTAMEMLSIEFEYDVEYLYFSGAKGFHIMIPSVCFGTFEPSSKLPAIFKVIVQDLLPALIYRKKDDRKKKKAAEGIDLALYDLTRLFRLTNSRNSKSGLYKIPLTRQEFNQGVTAIKEMAKDKRDNPFPHINDNVENDQFIEIYAKYKNDPEVTKKAKEAEPLDLYEAFDEVPDGSRDVTATKMAGLLKDKGLEKEIAIQMLLAWNQYHCNPPMEKQQVIKVANSVYRYDADVNVFQIFRPIGSYLDEYVEYVKDDTRKVNLGMPLIDERIRGVRPGEVLTWLGGTGNYKTALLHKATRHFYNYSNLPTIFMQLEMPGKSLVERHLQMCFEVSGAEIERIVKEDPSQIEDFRDILMAKYPHFYLSELPEFSYPKLMNYITIAERKIWKKKAGLLSVDFIQLMEGDGNNEVQELSDIAKKAKILAKTVPIPVQQVSQVTGIDSSYEPIQLSYARGSKTIGIMSDVVIGVWLAKSKNKSGKVYQWVALLKNRKGGLIRFVREIDPVSFKTGDPIPARELKDVIIKKNGDS